MNNCINFAQKQILMKNTFAFSRLMHGLMITSIVLFAVSCKQQGDQSANGQLSPDAVNNPASASGEKSNQNLPVFTFAEETHEFGKITQGEKVSYNFKFKNTGNADLLISNAVGSCGCTVPEYPKQPVPPGGEGTINVIFNSEGKEGKQNKTVTITSNTVPNSKILTITGEVLVPEGKTDKK